MRLGEFLVAQKAITHTQLAVALALQRMMRAPVPLGRILVDEGFITRSRLKLFLDVYKLGSRIGDILVKSGAITAEHLTQALAEQKRARLPLGETLIRLGHLTEAQLRQALCLQLNIEFCDLDVVPLEPSAKILVNERFARRHLVVPVSRVGNTLVVAMDDPTRIGLVEDLRSSTGLGIEVVTSTPASIRRALERLYGASVGPSPLGPEPMPIVGEPHLASLKDIYRLSVEPGKLDGKATTHLAATGSFEDADGLVQELLRTALAHGASDIHLEAIDGRTHVRFRIDGVLQQLSLDRLQEQLDLARGKVLSRLKILSHLDITERRRPQDGSFRARVEKDGDAVRVDFRTSVLPGHCGENVVIRILDSRSLPRSVDALGLADVVAAKLRHLLQSPTGIILVTGPTGSGKSTTLCGALKTVYRPGIKVLTAEDPIEYVCDEFCQHEINERVGNTFAKYLRAFLRHDPDVMMIGEIRDGETAELAFRAAQTGHLVLSTLHTNDAISALPRLGDLGIEAGLIASSLLGVLSQRLVREVCAGCKEPYTPSPELLDELFEVPPARLQWYRGAGCLGCNFTGYRGRLVLAELWVPNDADVVLINRAASFDDIRQSAQKSTLSMVQDVADKLRQGRTNLEELIRVLPHSCLRGLRSVAL